MNSLFKTFELKNHTIKNRVVMPPMVCFGWGDENGLINRKHIEHYEECAKGGTGIIIVEAACVNPNGRLNPNQIGLWNDEQINGLKHITDGKPIAINRQGAIDILERAIANYFALTGWLTPPMERFSRTMHESKRLGPPPVTPRD